MNMIPSWYPVNRTIVSFKEKKSVNTLNKDHLTPSDKDIRKADKKKGIKPNKQQKQALRDMLTAAYIRRDTVPLPRGWHEYTVKPTDLAEKMPGGIDSGMQLRFKPKVKIRKLRIVK